MRCALRSVGPLIGAVVASCTAGLLSIASTAHAVDGSASAARTTTAVAPGPSELEQCVQGALASLTVSQTTLGKQQTTFMLAGDSHVFFERYPDDGCLGFLVAGARHVQSLELALRAQDGRELARSGKPSALAYVRHCGVKGEALFATLRVLDGQGEVVYAELASDEPRPAAVRALEQCIALGTPRPAPLDMGPDPLGSSIDQQLQAARSELAVLGYDAGRLVAYGNLRAGEHAATGTALQRGHCYALVALGSEEVLDLDMRVFGPTLPLSAAGVDISRARTARVKLCARAPARYVMDVSAFQGEGAYAVAALELSEPAVSPGISGAARIDFAELNARMRARGFSPEVLTSGILGQEEQLSVPLSLRAGACYAVGALDSSEPGNEHGSAGLQLGLKAADGSLVALDAATGEAPLLFHCADRDEQLQAVVNAGVGRPQSRFVLLLGRDGEGLSP